jgi:hypothetical protein
MGKEATPDRYVGIDVGKDRVEVHIRPDAIAFGCETNTKGLEFPRGWRPSPKPRASPASRHDAWISNRSRNAFFTVRWRREPAGTVCRSKATTCSRRFRQRIEARDARAAALMGQSPACPLDVHVLLCTPAEIFQRGPTDPTSLACLARHWGTRDALREVVERPNPSPGRRLPACHAVISHGFLTAGETPRAAIDQFGARWPALRFALTPHPAR